MNRSCVYQIVNKDGKYLAFTDTMRITFINQPIQANIYPNKVIAVRALNRLTSLKKIKDCSIIQMSLYPTKTIELLEQAALFLEFKPTLSLDPKDALQATPEQIAAFNDLSGINIDGGSE